MTVQKGTMPVRVVLCMIVKNEERVLARALASVQPFVDAMMICDTGSTDDTVQIARAFGAHVSTEPWKNFGHNRTASVRHAEALVRERDWPLASTYYLFLDADMILHATKDFEKSALTEPWYLVEQSDGALRYWNTRLGRADYRWTSIGVTHEYWSPKDCGNQTKIQTISIDDRGDGGAKADKAERDIRLLIEGLEAEPENYRYMYYLAQTYSDVGNLPEAMRWYENRIAAGGWEEERWHARYKLGVVCLRSEDQATQERGAGILLQAFEERPSRAEPLYALARFYRDRGKNQLSYMLAARGKEISRPDDTLFVEEKPYANGFDEEISITGYYVGKKEEGRAAGERILAMKGLTEHVYAHMRQTVSFYVQPLLPHALRAGSFQISDDLLGKPERFFGLAEPSAIRYSSSSPTLVHYRDEVYVNVRLVNYYHERGRVFAPKDPDGVVRTRNVILRWDLQSDTVLSETESSGSLPAHWDHTTRVRGLEDQRWTAHNDRIWFTFTCFNIPGAGGMPRVALARVNEARDGFDCATELKYSATGRYEKNWLIWGDKGTQTKMVMVYGYDPFVVLSVDPATGECDTASVTHPPMDTGAWRGSCAPVRFGDSWIGMIHETAWFENHTIYMHRFVEFSDDMRILRASPLCTLEHSGVEYCLGLMLCPGAGRTDSERTGCTDYCLTYSVEESASRWMILSSATIERLLSGETP